MLRKLTTLSAAFIFSGWVSAGEQIITPDPLSQDIGTGLALNFDVKYSTKNPINSTLTGIGIRLHWNSSILTFNNTSNLLATSLMGQGSVEDDLLDFDGDSTTDKFINTGWADISGRWPGTNTATLYTANFTASTHLIGSYAVNFSDSSTALGSSFSANSAIINVVKAIMIFVPTVTGQVQSSAITKLTNAGLTIGSITLQPNNSVANGHVISQSPTPGHHVSAGSTINLVISSGAESVAVPSVTGQSQSSATAELTNAGLTIGTVTTQSDSSITNGHIISQSPASGSNISTGSVVDLVISSGVASITVPSVIGLSQSSATTTLTSAGINVGSITTLLSSSITNGTVISQHPSSGTHVDAASRVNLVISSGSLSIPVPSVTGKTKLAATNILTNVGFKVASRHRFHHSIASGKVITQLPKPGTEVSANHTVILIVSKGPADPKLFINTFSLLLFYSGSD